MLASVKELLDFEQSQLAVLAMARPATAEQLTQDLAALKAAHLLLSRAENEGVVAVSISSMNRSGAPAG
jgi:hypothetical protein